MHLWSRIFVLYSISGIANNGAALIRAVSIRDRNQNWCATTRPQVGLYVSVSTPGGRRQFERHSPGRRCGCVTSGWSHLALVSC